MPYAFMLSRTCDELYAVNEEHREKDRSDIPPFSVQLAMSSRSEIKLEDKNS